MKCPKLLIIINYTFSFRHLLSDQTDPFNRSPLTMDMVKSDVDLKKKIEEWIDQKKREEKKRERDTSTDDSQ